MNCSTCSTLVRNQLQALQMAFFFFLPSILLPELWPMLAFMAAAIALAMLRYRQTVN